MKRWCRICVYVLFSGLQLAAQDGIVTHNDFTAQTLVKDIFASGACDNIDLIVPIGNTEGIGYFENGSATIGLDKGIVLSSGPSWHAQGPNSSTDKSGDLSGPNGDGDLNRMSEGTVFDAVGITFDFVPLDSFVSFRYVFASEEYCEFVGSEYNDVFGFFVSGPGLDGPFIDDAENVARIPGTSDFVSINAVNFEQNSQYYIHNERPEDRGICGLENISTPHLNNIEYDGFTQVLTARLKVQPCETYHIRLVVGDVSDAFFDSAVFLEAGSFNLGGEIMVSSIGDTAGQGQLFEGCEDAAFRFSRSADSPIDRPLTVDYYLSSASTATVGVDFSALPQQVTIPTGEWYTDLPVHSLPDNIVEDEELIRLVLDIPCACYADSADLYIVPPPELEVIVNDVYICPGTEGIVSAVPTGGVTPYTFQWSGGSQEDSQLVSLETPIQMVTITDACDQSITEEVEVLPGIPPTAQLSGSDTICLGDTIWFPLELEAVPPVQLTYRLNDGPPTEIVLNGGSGFPAGSAGHYELLSIQDAACPGTAQGSADLTVWETTASATITPLKCSGGNDGSLQLEILSGDGPFAYQWSHNGPNEAVQENLTTGNYAATITDIHLCEAIFHWDVPEPAPLQIPIVDCADLFAGKLTAIASGGTPPYRYRLEDGPWYTDNSWLMQGYPGDSYQLHILDANDCSLETDWIMPATYDNGMASLPEKLELPLGVSVAMPVEYFLPPSLIGSVLWADSTHLSCDGCLYPNVNAIEAAAISLQLTDVFGCQQLLFMQLDVVDKVDAFIPNVFSPNGDEHNDLWSIYGNSYQIARIEQLLIFDRWGNHIFQANDWPINSDRHGWDGTWRGQNMDVGVYAYSVTFLLVNGERRTLGGDVLLMR